MTANKARKNAIRAHAQKTGKSYTAAQRSLDNADALAGSLGIVSMADHWNDPVTYDQRTLNARLADLGFQSSVAAADPHTTIDADLLSRAVRLAVAVWQEGQAWENMQNPSIERQAAWLDMSPNDLYGIDDEDDEDWDDEPYTEENVDELERPEAIDMMNAWATQTSGEVEIRTVTARALADVMTVVLGILDPDFEPHIPGHTDCGFTCQRWNDLYEAIGVLTQN